MKFIVAVSILVLLSGCGPSVKKLVFAVDPHWAPMEFVDDAKELQGFDIDLAKALAQEAGFSAEIRVVPWDRLMAGLDSGAYDVVASSVVINASRQARYEVSDPYLNDGQVLVVRRGSPLTRLEDVQGKAVGALVGSWGADVVNQGGKRGPALKTYNSLDLALQDLADGRLEGVVAQTSLVAHYTLRDRRFKDSLHIVGAPLTQENLGLVVAKGNHSLVETLNAALGRMKASGSLDDLTTRWLR